MKQVYGIIGYPLGHSLSPYMHSRFAYYLNMDQEYRMYDTKPEILEYTVNNLYNEHVLGLNVTLPYKQEIQKYLCSIDKAAGMIGAVNTLKYSNHGYIGYNTDYLGLRSSLKSANISLKGENVLILGAGGAARAVAYLAKEAECHELTVLNRTLRNAQDICDDFQGIALDYSMLDHLTSDYIVFQATNVGMHPYINDVLPLPDELYSHFKAAIDIVYNPLKTEFLKTAEKNGVSTLNGFDMLINQAIESRKIWNPDEIISKDIKMRVYDECIGYKWS